MGAPTDLPVLHRTAAVTRKDGDDARVELSFSSEEPVMRWFGSEVLGHAEGEADLSWIGSGHANALMDHDARISAIVGVVERAWLANRRGMATVRLATTPDAIRLKGLIDDGIVSSISVGYRIDEMQEAGQTDAGEPVYRATSWRPTEISFVASPADVTVGVGRGDDEQDAGRRYPVTVRRSATMNAPVVTEPTADEAARAERDRIVVLQQYGARYGDVDGPTIAAAVIAEGGSIEDLRARIDAAERRARQSERVGYTGDYAGGPPLGMDVQRDLRPRQQAPGVLRWARGFDMGRDFSLRRALGVALARSYVPGFELKDFDGPEAAGLVGPSEKGRGLHIGPEILSQTVWPAPRRHGLSGRVLQVDGTTAGQAQNLVEQQYLEGSYIDSLRNYSAILGMATVLADLVGDVEIPRQTASVAAAWAADEITTALAVGDPAFDQVTLEPHELGIAVRYSRKTLVQTSPDIEMLLRADFAKDMALGVDRAIIAGTGADGQPQGFLGNSGVTTVSLGANGADPTHAKLVELAGEVLDANAAMLPEDPSGAVDMAGATDACYVTNSKVWRKLVTTPVVANEPAMLLDSMGRIHATPFRLKVSNQMPSDLDKGTATDTLSAIAFGKWSDVLVGWWTGLDVEVITDQAMALKRQNLLIAWQDVDTELRYDDSVAKIVDATTA